MFHYEDETITLAQYLKKMRYYAPNLNRYVRKWRHDKKDCGRQFSLWYRFWKVFTENGKWVRLLRHPVLALNMYWLKILSILVFLLGRNDTGSKKGAIQKEEDSPFHKQALEPRVIHVEFAKTGTGLSGGEKCMIENIQYFLKQKLRNILFTTDNGRHTYEKLGLKEGPFFEYRTIRSHSHETRYPMLLSYIVRVFQAVRHVRSFQIFDNDILFCHSEFFPNTIPFYLLARKNLKAKIFYWAHMPSPHLFKGYVGHFSNTFHFPNLKIIFLKLNQVFYAAIRNNRGTVLSVNEYFRKKLGSEFKGNRVYIVRRYGGVSVSQEETTRKEYDLAWMGRFHPQKGIMEIPEILNRLKELGRNSSLILLGGGSDSLKDKLFAKLDLYGLKTQVDWKGFISGDQKFDSLRKARLYLMTSYYEGFPGVVLEAMKCGIPVLAYDLPIYAPYVKGMVKVPFLDNGAMARVALDLLSDSKRYDRLCQDALKFSSLYSWENTSEEILDLMKLPEPSTLNASVERS
jgi:glycosyltransferase involved in cell wall biosynthesis